MRRTSTEVKLGNGKIRYSVTIESEPCTWGSPEARMMQIDLIKHLASQPALMQCGTETFQQMTMRHDGQRWSVSLQAVGKEA